MATDRKQQKSQTTILPAALLTLRQCSSSNIIGVA